MDFTPKDEKLGKEDAAFAPVSADDAGLSFKFRCPALEPLLKGLAERSNLPGKPARKVILLIDAIYGQPEQTRKAKAITDAELEKSLKDWLGRKDNGPQQAESFAGPPLPTPQEIGEMAAQECRAGAASDVACMKPLRLKRGFLTTSSSF